MNDYDLNEESELPLFTNDDPIDIKTKKEYLIDLLKHILIVFFVISCISFFYFSFVGPNFLSYITDTSKLSIVQEQAKLDALEVSEDISDEAIVLLENKDNFLPLSSKNIAHSKDDDITSLNVFGIGSIALAYGESPSSSSEHKILELEMALESPKLSNGGFLLNKDLLALYHNYYSKGEISLDNYKNDKAKDGYFKGDDLEVLEEPPIEVFTDTSLYLPNETIIDQAKAFSNTSLVVISRYEKDTLDTPISQLKITEDEKALLDMVTDNFENVILLINSNTTMDLDFLDNYPNIKSILSVGYLGENGAKSIAKVLDGTVTPSGRLSDTWLYNNLENPATNNFLQVDSTGNWMDESFTLGDYTRKNPPFTRIVTKMSGSSPIGYTLNYAEGIYVGYKYFETRYKTDLTYDYDSIVKYPFGYGLSYTSFSKEIRSYNEDNGVVTIEVEVLNTGEYKGKDVVQLYYEPPYSGTIEKSTTNLLAFGKTKSLNPMEKTIVTLTFNLEDLASYDYVNNNTYLLEKGNYYISLNSNAHDKLSDVSTITIERDILFNDTDAVKRISDFCTTTPTFTDGNISANNLTRSFDENAYAFTGDIYNYNFSKSVDDILYYTPEKDSSRINNLPFALDVTFEKPIKLRDLKSIDYDSELWDSYISQFSVNELSTLVSDGAWHISHNNDYGIPKAYMIDSKNGIYTDFYSGSITGNDVHGVIYPSNTSLASTWNMDLAYKYGESISKEAKSFGYVGIYTGGLNIHRTAYDGNYSSNYSEDSLLSGKIGASFTKATTDNGIVSFVKNFVLSERQTKNTDCLLVFANEQALREIYLKPFEIAIKEGNAQGVMTSYSFVGETWSGSNSALLETVLRDEWGFKGIVTTDLALYSHMNIYEAVTNGTDLYFDVTQGLFKNFGKHRVLCEYATTSDTEENTVYNLQRSAKNILYTLSRTYIVE